MIGAKGLGVPFGGLEVGGGSFSSAIVMVEEIVEEERKLASSRSF